MISGNIYEDMRSKSVIQGHSLNPVQLKAVEMKQGQVRLPNVEKVSTVYKARRR